MKIKRAMAILILVLAVLFTMSGCYGFNYNIEINENGGSVVQSLLVSKEALDMTKRAVEGMQDQTSEDSVEETKMENAEDDDYEIYEIDGTQFLRETAYTDDADSLAALEERMNTLSLQETYAWAEAMATSQEEMQSLLKEAEEQQGEQRMYILRDVHIETGKISNSMTLTGYIIDYQHKDLELSEGIELACSIDLKFPGTITEYTVGKKIDDTTLQINLNELWAGDSDIAFTVRAELPGSNTWIVVVLAVCAIVGIGGFVLYRKRRSSVQPQDAPEASGEAELQETLETSGEEESQEKTEEASGEEPVQNGKNC